MIRHFRYCFDSRLHNSDDKLLQNITLSTDFGDSSSIEVKHEKDDEWIVRSSTLGDEISFIIEVDSEDFSSIYVKRSFKRKQAYVSDCLSIKSHNW